MPSTGSVGGEKIDLHPGLGADEVDKADVGAESGGGIRRSGEQNQGRLAAVAEAVFRGHGRHGLAVGPAGIVVVGSTRREDATLGSGEPQRRGAGVAELGLEEVAKTEALARVDGAFDGEGRAVVLAALEELDRERRRLGFGALTWRSVRQRVSLTPSALADAGMYRVWADTTAVDAAASVMPTIQRYIETSGAVSRR